jgi:hypothetical protein
MKKIQLKNSMLACAIALVMGSSFSWANTVEEVVDAESDVTVYRDTTASIQAVASSVGDTSSSSSSSDGWTTISSSSTYCYIANTSSSDSTSTCTIASLGDYDIYYITSSTLEASGNSSSSADNLSDFSVSTATPTLSPATSYTITSHTGSFSETSETGDNNVDEYECSATAKLYISNNVLYVQAAKDVDNKGAYCSSGYLVTGIYGASL